jgi:hypothetical protein
MVIDAVLGIARSAVPPLTRLKATGDVGTTEESCMESVHPADARTASVG